MSTIEVPEVSARVAPWAAVEVSGVTTSGGIRSRVTAGPWARPTRPATAGVARTARTAGPVGRSARMLNPGIGITLVPDRAPADKSMPPVGMAGDSPIAISPYRAGVAPITRRLTALAEVSRASASAANVRACGGSSRSLPVGGGAGEGRGEPAPALGSSVWSVSAHIPWRQPPCSDEEMTDRQLTGPDRPFLGVMCQKP
ncbi:hypothetical protein [Kitasatospora sp. NPDC097643]|uniref:hypothetical protein n=1 Tax=Kitasatospora sp. NPDC097643 TaxID=3157230 RepID=UPI00332B38E1